MYKGRDAGLEVEDYVIGCRGFLDHGALGTRPETFPGDLGKLLRTSG